LKISYEWTPYVPCVIVGIDVDKFNDILIFFFKIVITLLFYFSSFFNISDDGHCGPCLWLAKVQPRMKVASPIGFDKGLDGRQIHHPRVSL